MKMSVRFRLRHQAGQETIGWREGIGSTADATLRSVCTPNCAMRCLRRARGKDAPAGLPPGELLSALLSGLRGGCNGGQAAAGTDTATRGGRGGTAKAPRQAGGGRARHRAVAVERRGLGCPATDPREARRAPEVGSVAPSLAPVEHRQAALPGWPLADRKRINRSATPKFRVEPSWST